MDQRIIDLYDEYTHKPLTREVFIRKLTQITGSTAAAMAILPMLEVNYAQAATIPQEDQRLQIDRVSYQGDDQMNAYLARPKGDTKLPAVVVIHENRGLNPHIEDVARRMALEGFLAIAPDALSPLGGYPGNEDEARTLFQKLDATKNTNNFVKVFDYLATRKDLNGRYGCIGFCWGGAMSNQLAVHVPSLKAAIPFYGRQPEAADVPKIKAALQLHYAETDERINAGIAAYEEALKKAGVRYELYQYPGTQHAFHNDTAPTRYNAEAAKQAWRRSIDFLNSNLKG
jgi:carboxymethylenebutenolidase